AQLAEEGALHREPLADRIDRFLGLPGAGVGIGLAQPEVPLPQLLLVGRRQRCRRGGGRARSAEGDPQQQGQGCPHVGLGRRPRNRTQPVRLSRIRNRNGWSAVTSTGSSRPFSESFSPSKVAAAASEPCSFTSTKARCKTP